MKNVTTILTNVGADFAQSLIQIAGYTDNTGLWRSAKIGEMIIMKGQLETTTSGNIVFIVGVPRSGSTYLFQLITHQLQVRYPNRLVCRIPSAAKLAFWLSEWYQRRPVGHSCFTSNYGSSPGCKLSAPSECGSLLHKFFPLGGNDSTDTPNLDDLQEFKKIMQGVVERCECPLIFKNLEASNWIRTLTALFPGARFIHIQRDPLFNAQSILIGRRKRGIDGSRDWSVLPRDWKKDIHSDEFVRVARQVINLDRQISSDLALHAADNATARITYEELMAQPDTIIEQLRVLMGNPDYRTKASAPPPPHNGNRIRLAADEVEKLQTCLKECSIEGTH